MNFLLMLSLLLMLPIACDAARGKLILHNGNSLTGDIQKNPDGSCWITLKNGSIQFDKQEIRKVIIYSQRDTVSEKFTTAFKITPGNGSGPTPSATPYDGIIDQAANKHHLDPALVKAVVKVESNFNPEDRSSKGACGLMQLMPDTARILGVKDIYSPSENIHAGTRFLKDMMYLFNGDTEKALAAYNAGPGAVKRYGSVPPYRETRNYVRQVNSYYRRYRTSDKIYSYTDESGCLKLYNVR
jgi:soluble lytic murein transglycosylase-like protein